jgi:Uma2 family endonuclease
MAIRELEAPTMALDESQRLVLHDISWRRYLRLLDIFNGHNIRLTYDEGTLEIMTLSSEHERYKRLLDRLIYALADEFDKAVASYGSTTLKSGREAKGLEPDECYWFKDEQTVRFMKRFDPRRYPPPELVVEIDVTHSSVDRLSIYAAFLVPEVWRYDGQNLTCLWLNQTGGYTAHERSRVFPNLAIADVAHYLALAATIGEMDMVRQFRAWVRDHLV